MPLTKARRPKYERHDIKQHCFSIQLSYQRLNKIQRLLVEKGIDGLLIIIGIDGRFNSGSLEVFNYLLFDVYSTRKDDMERSKLDDDIFDDVMICIQTDEVHVYLNGANYWLLLPYISHWPGLRLHCISEVDLEESENAEDFKIKAFVEMTRRCSTVAVSTRPSYMIENNSFDPMQLEDWPIIQSFAYDDFGKYSNENSKKGFFTLVHKVTDLSNEISRLCRHIDPVYLENVYVKILPQIEGLFENIFQLIDTKCYSKEFEINEETLEEPVTSYFSHYKGVNMGQLDNLQMCPFVLAGTNTRRFILEDKMMNGLKSISNNRNKLVKNPTHLIIQCVSLQTGMVITRTVFMNYSPSSFDEGRIPAVFIDDDVRNLSSVYNRIIKTAEYVIDKIKTDSKIQLSLIDGQKYLKTLLDDVTYSDCKFSMQCVGEKSQTECFVIIIQGVVFDIINTNSNYNLGSVMFADTFVINCTPLQPNEDLNSVLRYGKQIPIFSYWTDQRLSGLNNRLRSVYKMDTLGSENVDILLTNNNSHEDFIFNECCTFYEDRMLLFNRRTGASLIYPISVEIFEGKLYGDWTVLTLHFQKDETSSNFIWTTNDKCSLHMVFKNHSSERKFISNVVLPLWKEKIPVTYIDQLTCPYFAKSWSNIQSWMSQHLSSDQDSHNQSIMEGISDESNRSCLAKVLQNINNSVVNKNSTLRIFCRLIEISYSLHYLNTVDYITQIQDLSTNLYESLDRCWGFVNIMDQNKLIKIKKPIEPLDEKITVTVLCGLPGSGHDIVAKKVTKIINEDVTWILVNLNTMETFSKDLEKAIVVLKKQSLTKNGRQMRMILLAPSMCSPIVICESIMTLKTDILLEIGSSCFCIDPHAVYLNENELTIPGLLDMCSEGWVTCILLTGQDNNSSQTNNLHRLLHSKNDLCTIFRTPKAEINKEIDTILSPVAFQQTRFALSRIIIGNATAINKFSVKGIKQIAPEFFEITFPLFSALSKEHITLTYREILKSMQSSPIEKNIYFIDGIFGLIEDSSHLFSFNAVSLCKQLSFLPVKEKSAGDDYYNITNTYIRVYIISSDLQNLLKKNEYDKIEIWKNELLVTLRKFQIRSPEKKKKLTFSDLTKTQVENIHKLRHLESLPEGWFYNGLSYVHMDGTKSDKHPGLQYFIEEFLRDENASIEEFNSKIEEVSFADAFCKS